MRFEWDEAKSRKNLKKHSVSFKRASLVFDDPRCLSMPDEYELEERWQTMGLANGVVLLSVVHTMREEENEEIIRIISARKATKGETKRYEESPPNERG